MTAPGSCPTVEQLRELITGRVSEPQASRWQEHLVMCSACQAQTSLMNAEDTILAAPRTEKGKDEPASNREQIDRSRSSLSGMNTVILDPEEKQFAASVSGRIGEYDIVREIARGGMGIVYQARHRTLGRIAAVKLIKSGELARSEEIQRFHVEAQAAAQLDHPGIVPVYEVGQLDQQHYLAMAFVDGESLWQRVKESPLKPHEAARILQQVAEAVQYAHERGIVHRDLKPQNILLTKQGQPKVTDFGLAKKQGGDSSLTATGQILGTPSYMPPEQTKGMPNQIGPAADIYSLGATLYCLLVGRPPFQAATPLETLVQVVEQEPASLHLLNPAIPRDLETICLKCLQKDPRLRYASCGELAADLGRFLQGEPILARRTGRLEKTWRWCRRNPVGAALAGSFMLLIGLGGLTFWLVREQQRYQEVSHVVDSIEKLLDRPSSETSFIDQGDALLTALRIVAPERVPEDQARIRQAYSKAVEADILQPKLSDDAARNLGSALERLAKESPDEAARLQKLLDGRRQGWQSLAELAAPFSNREQALAGQTLDVIEGRLFRSVSDSANPDSANTAVPTQISGSGKIRFETVFAADWQTARHLGIEFQYDAGNRYRFLLSAVPAERSDSGTDTTMIQNFESARRGGGQIKIEIFRNGVVLRSQVLPATAITAELLRLEAQRREDRLEFRVSGLSPLVFDDIFPIHSREPARFALVWPPGVGLEQFQAATMPAAQTVHPLEEGDLLLSEGKFNAALGRYREAGSVSADDELRQEAKYKHGVCLVELQRLDDAAELFESLAASEGERWPMLATIQLWLVQIRLQHRERADEIFEHVAGRYSFDELAVLIPTQLRSELVGLYSLEAGPRFIRFLTYDSQRVPRLERRIKLLDLFDDDLGNRLNARSQLIDAVWAAGNVDLAHQLAADAMQFANSQPHVDARYLSSLVGVYQPSMFQRGAASVLLSSLENDIKARPDSWLAHDPAPQLWRAQCLSQAGHWEDAERAIEQGDELLPNDDHIIGFWKLTSNLVRGFVREKRGDHEGALAAWRAGVDLEPHVKAGRMTWLQYLLLRGLSGDVDRSDANVFISRLANAQGGSVESAVRSFLNADELVPVIRGMFQTPHGRHIAWQIAIGELFPSEEAEAMISLFLYEMLRQNAFGGEFSQEQHEMLWSLCRSELRAIAQRGKYSVLQFGQAGLAWKGTMSVFGWGGLAPQLSSDIRGPVAYALAHRMLRRTQVEHAKKLFQEALDDASSNSALEALATQDVALLDAGNGLVILRHPGPNSIDVEISSEGRVTHTIKVDQQAELPLPVGDYAWQITGSQTDTSLRKGKFSLTLCSRRLIDLSETP